MTLQAVLLPLFVQVALTFALMFRMGYLRVSSVERGEVRIADIALREHNWTPRTMQVANAFHNQLELPMLFYVLTIFAWIAREADLLFVVMAWTFVALRFGHAFIHVTNNNVRQRALVFGGGALVLIAMWIIFAVRILLAL